MYVVYDQGDADVKACFYPTLVAQSNKRSIKQLFEVIVEGFNDSLAQVGMQVIRHMLQG